MFFSREGLAHASGNNPKSFFEIVLSLQFSFLKSYQKAASIAMKPLKN